ncbi:MAG: haloacid dehalogenase-like hydrolase [Bdellovibrionales bacterium]|nr:haloacid dehalogenase-like hydrolase [Bdellovibrionales bacterium]
MEKIILKKIQYQIEEALENTDLPVSAAFDADGTLWPCDMGKNFFQYQVEKGLFKEKIQDPFVEFNRLSQEKSRKIALMWLAQIQSGVSLEQMEEWVKDFLKENPFSVFRFQKNLIEWMVSKNISVFVVSSSLKWVLDQALKAYPIPKNNIIGVKTQVEGGIITDKPIQPAPIHADKVEAFQRQQLKKQAPIFVAGNTLSDQALLELSSYIRLVVATARPGGRNYESERKLLNIAKEKHWFYQDQMPDLIK